MIVIVLAAAIWRDVQIVVWAVAITDSLRLAGSAFLWWRWDRQGRSAHGIFGAMREQWRFCTATGLSRLVVILNRNIGAVLIDRTLGEKELARFTVATYPEPAISAVTKSVFNVSLPELVRRRAKEGAAGFDVWKRTVSWSSAGILPLLAYTLVAARDLVHVGFGEEYVSAAPLLQVLLIVMARKCFDFATPLQAIGETRPLLLSNVISLAVNALALALLLPRYGSLGVVIAIAIANMVEPLMLAPLVSRRFQQPLKRMLYWGEMGKILLCALAVAAVARAVQGAGLAPLAYLAVSAPVAFGAGAVVLLLTRSSCVQAVLRVLRSRTHRLGLAR
jgi:O-antigen/teichoic acid export membrane protein